MSAIEKPEFLCAQCREHLDSGDGDLPFEDCENCLHATIAGLTEARERAERELAEAKRAWNGPETEDFLEGLRKEAAHQVARWGIDHDAGKITPEWYWLLGYLGGKALHAAQAGDVEKAKHHTITTAAALMSWHRQLSQTEDNKSPGTGGLG